MRVRWKEIKPGVRVAKVGSREAKIVRAEKSLDWFLFVEGINRGKFPFQRAKKEGQKILQAA